MSCLRSPYWAQGLDPVGLSEWVQLDVTTVGLFFSYIPQLSGRSHRRASRSRQAVRQLDGLPALRGSEMASVIDAVNSISSSHFLCTLHSLTTRFVRVLSCSTRQFLSTTLRSLFNSITSPLVSKASYSKMNNGPNPCPWEGCGRVFDRQCDLKYVRFSCLSKIVLPRTSC